MLVRSAPAEHSGQMTGFRSIGRYYERTPIRCTLYFPRETGAWMTIIQTIRLLNGNRFHWHLWINRHPRGTPPVNIRGIPPVVRVKKQKISHLRGDKPQRRSGRYFFISLLALFVLCMGTLVGASVGAINSYLDNMPTIDYLENYQPSMPTRMYDIRSDIARGIPGTLIADFQTGTEPRSGYPCRIPQNLIHAVIAIEDRNFTIISELISGALPVLLMWIWSRSRRQGAGTLTIQLGGGSD